MTDTLYTAAAYKPQFVSDSGTFHLDETGSTNPVTTIAAMSVSRAYRVDSYNVPGINGTSVLGTNMDGLQISLTLEIASATLSEWDDRRIDLEAILEGNEYSQFDFYLRKDGDNYWVYKNCVVTSYAPRVGAQDPKNPEIVTNCTIDIELLSEDATPTIKNDGTFLQGGTDPETSGVTIIGSTKLLIADELIVQNNTGDIKFRVSAITQTMEVVGTITETL